MYRALGSCNHAFEVPPPIAIAPLEIQVSERVYSTPNSPEVWGESFWFVVHLGSLNAPDVIPPEKQEKYWNFIDGLPEMLACQKCAHHARAWVEQHRPQKDKIVATRKALVQFYVDMHNDVNQRNKQPLLSVEEVERKFAGPVRVRHFRYQ